MCQSFVGNYSMNIVDMIVSNKTSSQICNALGSCTPRADDENDQVLRTLVLIKPENNEDDKKVLENINKDEDDDEIDNSNMNTGEVEPDYDYHENRVGNDDSQNDNTNQFQVLHDELNEDDGVETDEDDQIEPDFDYHENRVGNDDSQNDNTNQFQLNEDDEVYLPTIHVQNLQNNVAADEKLCKTCKVVVTSVLTKTTDKSSKV